jgi:hypothetical protein
MKLPMASPFRIRTFKLPNNYITLTETLGETPPSRQPKKSQGKRRRRRGKHNQPRYNLSAPSPLPAFSSTSSHLAATVFTGVISPVKALPSISTGPFPTPLTC